MGTNTAPQGDRWNGHSRHLLNTQHPHEQTPKGHSRWLSRVGNHSGATTHIPNKLSTAEPPFQNLLASGDFVCADHIPISVDYSRRYLEGGTFFLGCLITLLPMPTPRLHPFTYIAKSRFRGAEKERPFPYGDFRKGSPPEVFLAAALARRLKERIGDESIRYIAKKADLSPQTILNILNGRSWPDLRTIAKLENALNGQLWGSEHRQYRSRHRYRYTSRRSGRAPFGPFRNG